MNDTTPSPGLSRFQELFWILSSCNLPGMWSSPSLPLSTDLLRVAKDIRAAGAEGHTPHSFSIVISETPPCPETLPSLYPPLSYFLPLFRCFPAPLLLPAPPCPACRGWSAPSSIPTSSGSSLQLFQPTGATDSKCPPF